MELTGNSQIPPSWWCLSCVRVVPLRQLTCFSWCPREPSFKLEAAHAPGSSLANESMGRLTSSSSLDEDESHHYYSSPDSPLGTVGRSFSAYSRNPPSFVKVGSATSMIHTTSVKRRQRCRTFGTISDALGAEGGVDSLISSP